MNIIPPAHHWDCSAKEAFLAVLLLPNKALISVSRSGWWLDPNAWQTTIVRWTPLYVLSLPGFNWKITILQSDGGGWAATRGTVNAVVLMEIFTDSRVGKTALTVAVVCLGVFDEGISGKVGHLNPSIQTTYSLVQLIQHKLHNTLTLKRWLLWALVFWETPWRMPWLRMGVGWPCLNETGLNPIVLSVNCYSQEESRLFNCWVLDVRRGRGGRRRTARDRIQKHWPYVMLLTPVPNHQLHS